MKRIQIELTPQGFQPTRPGLFQPRISFCALTYRPPLLPFQVSTAHLFLCCYYSTSNHGQQEGEAAEVTPYSAKAISGLPEGCWRGPSYGGLSVEVPTQQGGQDFSASSGAGLHRNGTVSRGSRFQCGPNTGSAASPSTEPYQPAGQCLARGAKVFGQVQIATTNFLSQPLLSS